MAETADEVGTTRVGYWAEHDRDDGLAQQCLTLLCKAYPGHGWWIRITGGIIFIQILGMTKNHGMSLHYKKVLIDPETLRKAVLFSGGELLERAGLTRGAKTDETVRHIEGIADKYLL
jgi:hypothetical protein